MWCFFRVLLLGCWVLLACTATTAAIEVAPTSTSASRKMYLFSDVHLDPYYGTPTAYGPCTSPTGGSAPTFGAATCDTPLPLFTSAISDIQQHSQQDSNSMFMMTGDALRHDMYTFGDDAIQVAKNIDEVIATVIKNYLVGGSAANITTATKKPSKATATPMGPMLHVGSRPNALLLQGSPDEGEPTTPSPGIIITFGNNDAIPDYLYSPNASAAAHPATSNATSVYLAHGLLAPSEAINMSRCGFYSRQMTPTANPGDPTSPLLLLSLNTNIYSQKNSLIDPATQPDPCGQFAWLESVLGEARAVNAANVRAGGSLFAGSIAVHVMGHIVPFAKKWNPQYLQRYFSIMTAFEDIVRVQWFAHTHMFSFMAAPNRTGPPLLQIPSITPRDGNLPSYLRTSFDTNWNIKEIHHRSFDLKMGTWGTAAVFGKKFNSALTSPLTTASLNAYALKLLVYSHSSTHWLDFLAAYQGGAVTNPLSKKKKLKVVCDMISIDIDSYESCKANN